MHALCKKEFLGFDRHRNSQTVAKRLMQGDSLSLKTRQRKKVSSLPRDFDVDDIT